MKYPFFIAKRYLFTKSSKNAVNIISRIAVIAVILGSMALFVVLSGFSGLKDFALDFTNVFDSDLRVIPAKGKTLLLSTKNTEQLADIQGVVAVSRVLEERVFIRYEGKNHIAYIKGVDENYARVTPIDSLLFVGDWLIPSQDEVVVGFGISSKLSMPIRDYSNLMELYVPKPGVGQINELDPSSAFKSARAVASGIYEINDDLNDKFVFSDLSLAQELMEWKESQISYVEFKLSEDADESVLIPKLKALFPEEVIVKNRIQQNDALYKMLNSENLFTYLFVSLIAAIAIFNLAGTIIMIILEKRKNIKTLYFLGLTIKEIRRIFFYNGMLMTVLGVSIGLFLGSTIVLLQLEYGFVPITPSLPYPVKFKIANLIIVLCTILALGGFASKIATLRVTEKLLS